MGMYHEDENKKGASRTMEILGTIGFGGVVAALLSGNGNGFLGNLFGGGNDTDQKISALESGLVFEAGKNYADKTAKEVYQAVYAAQQTSAEKAAVTAGELAKLQGEIDAERRVAAEVAKVNKLETELAVQRATAPLLLRLQRCEDSIPLVQERCMGAIAAEASARKCGDNAIVNYVNATFYPKMVAAVTTGETTTQQTTYNPLPCQAPCPCPAA